ncbi:unnamed protein product [Pleuronectes platessa]|uniref:Uncharacterized protein n=1 Tax=Pleuronectes platessa TaxID=8262 RepID=A0A9N7VAH2_PLEPL|nr:unnamed protein product [Pleuronectes platessa]
MKSAIEAVEFKALTDLNLARYMLALSLTRGSMKLPPLFLRRALAKTVLAACGGDPARRREDVSGHRTRIRNLLLLHRRFLSPWLRSVRFHPLTSTEVCTITGNAVIRSSQCFNITTVSSIVSSSLTLPNPGRFGISQPPGGVTAKAARLQRPLKPVLLFQEPFNVRLHFYIFF